MKILLYGTYERQNFSNTCHREGLLEAGETILEFHEPLWDLYTDKSKFFSNPYSLMRKIAFAQGALWRRRKQIPTADIMLVSYIGQFDMFLARRIANQLRIPLVFDPLISLSDTLSDDRAVVSAHSIKGKMLRFLDKKSCSLADALILDTSAHADFFSREFHIPRNKIHVSFLGLNKNQFYPKERKKSGRFTVLFVGKFIPGHGLDYILDAAKMLMPHKDIAFSIVGEGQLFKYIQSRVREEHITNVTLPGWVAYKDLPPLIAQANICLGLFGPSDKSQRVIPTKIFEAIAMKRAVVTGDGPGPQEAFTHKKNVWLVPRADSNAIAEAIIYLKNNPFSLRKLEDEGYKLFLNTFTYKQVGERLKAILTTVLR